jgi:hypothetical protein
MKFIPPAFAVALASALYQQPLHAARLIVQGEPPPIQKTDVSEFANWLPPLVQTLLSLSLRRELIIAPSSLERDLSRFS